jgi:ribose 1,5-bisphosphokinase PhnN
MRVFGEVRSGADVLALSSRGGNEHRRVRSRHVVVIVVNPAVCVRRRAQRSRISSGSA